jgi:hypothetical protein
LKEEEMMRMIGIVILVAMAATSATASTDPFVGKWKLDVWKSTYPPGSCPRSMIIEMRAAERGIRYQSDAIYKNGSEMHAQYTAGYDGKQAMVLSAHGMLLPVSLKRIDSRTVVASYMRGLQVVAISRRVVSADGKQMTITTTSRQKTRESVRTIGIYIKEAAR